MLYGWRKKYSSLTPADQMALLGHADAMTEVLRGGPMRIAVSRLQEIRRGGFALVFRQPVASRAPFAARVPYWVRKSKAVLAAEIQRLLPEPKKGKLAGRRSALSAITSLLAAETAYKDGGLSKVPRFNADRPDSGGSE